MEANRAGDGGTGGERGGKAATYPKVVGDVYTAAISDEALAPRTKSLVRRSRSRPPSAAPARGNSGGRSGIPLHDASFGGGRPAGRAD
jgi:hypothetical protein